MNYFAIHNGQQQGPFTLEELRKELADGRIALTDEVRGDGADQSIAENPMLVRQILGVAAPPPGIVGTMPPRLHWGVLLALMVLTGGLFSVVWMFVQARFVKKLDPASNALWWYIGGWAILLVGGIVAGIDAGLSEGQIGSGTPGALGLVEILGMVVWQIGYFRLRRSLENYYTRVENIHLQLSTRMTLFFNIVYFQYHFNRIRRWKLTGVLS